MVWACLAEVRYQVSDGCVPSENLNVGHAACSLLGV